MSMAITPAYAQSITLTGEQQTWLDQLAQDPDHIDSLMKMEADRLLAEQWNQVTSLTVNDLHVASGISGRDSTGTVTSVKVGTKVYPWASIATPKNASVPIFLKVKWYHESDPGDAQRVVTVDITSPSPAWRTWDAMTVRHTGGWTIKVTQGDTVLATTTLTVTP